MKALTDYQGLFSLHICQGIFVGEFFEFQLSATETGLMLRSFML
ncbi:hypothetical protein STRCR_0355 [Streptococcus criceti HS-6]|uniref:Uncharacterized protein n=1 Tax=Streptococcus criceti HS-6 TaxID=873449 RepID=G5JPK2_STRCG|nr:hypothetical protein STRCR_0355 [Streptococcus criceti HS-6]